MGVGIAYVGEAFSFKCRVLSLSSLGGASLCRHLDSVAVAFAPPSASFSIRTRRANFLAQIAPTIRCFWLCCRLHRWAQRFTVILSLALQCEDRTGCLAKLRRGFKNHGTVEFWMGWPSL